MKTKLRYNPDAYVRLAEVAGWLADGKHVQVRHTGVSAKLFGRRWMRFQGGSAEDSLRAGLEFRVAPARGPKKASRATRGVVT